MKLPDSTEHEPLLPIEKRLILWSVGLGLVLLGVLFWLSHTFFPATVQPGAPPQAAAASARTVPPAPTSADITFMQQMIHHHAQAIAMVELLKTRTTWNDLTLLAGRIEVSQNDEIRAMKAWLEEHHGEVPMDHGHGAMMVNGQMMSAMPGMLSDEQMAALGRARGREFDRLFLTGMIQHHEGALAMVQELLKSPGAGEEPAIFDFITHVDSDQRIEIARMQQMLGTLK